MNELWRILRNPRVSISLVLSAAVAGGFVMFLVAYRRTSSLNSEHLQVPYLVSAGAAGVAAIGAGLTLLRVHLDRVEAADEIRQIVDLRRRLRSQLPEGSV